MNSRHNTGEHTHRNPSQTSGDQLQHEDQSRTQGSKPGAKSNKKPPAAFL
jgi:hypothetical protein